MNPVVELEAYSVESFCEAHSISRSFFYELLNRGRGPRTLKIGKKVLISRESAAEWRNQRSPNAIRVRRVRPGGVTA